MTRRITFGILIALVVIAGAAGLGITTYRIGYVQGLQQSGKIEFVAPPQGAPDGLGPRGGPWGYGYGGPGYYGPYEFGPFGGWGFGWGFGPFGFLRCLIPLFFFFLLFALLRGLFWRRWGGGWGHRHWGPGPGQGVPPPFEEWHKRAHEQTPPAPSASNETPTTQA